MLEAPGLCWLVTVGKKESGSDQTASPTLPFPPGHYPGPDGAAAAGGTEPGGLPASLPEGPCPGPPEADTGRETTGGAEASRALCPAGPHNCCCCCCCRHRHHHHYRHCWYPSQVDKAIGFFQSPLPTSVKLGVLTKPPPLLTFSTVPACSLLLLLSHPYCSLHLLLCSLSPLL